MPSGHKVVSRLNSPFVYSYFSREGTPFIFDIATGTNHIGKLNDVVPLKKQAANPLQLNTLLENMKIKITHHTTMALALLCFAIALVLLVLAVRV